MRWEELPMASRARLMAAAVRNGYTDIRSIKEAYANYQNLKLTTGNRYDEGGEFEVVNLLDDVPVEYNTEDTGYTPWFIQNTEHASDNPMTNQQYYSLMEKVATENNPIWNIYRKEEGLPELTVDEEYTRILNDNSYDYRGYYNDPAVRNSNDNANTHWPDEYKTAYHPTFSTYSLYSGMVDPNYNPIGKNGGLWFGDNYINYNQNAYGGNLFKNGGNNQKQSKRDYYRQQLIIRGLRGAQLEAVLNNMEVESGFNPTAYNKSSGARGLMQWLGSRKPKSWSEKDQLDYIARTYNQFGGDAWLDKSAYKRFNETTDAKEASYLFRRYWERPEKSSWHATDKFYTKGNKTTFLPNEVNDLVEQVSNLSYSEPKAPIFTEADLRLLDTSALAFYNPEYVDRNDPNYRSALADAVALDESLDTPANNWAKWNAFLSMQSGQSDPVSSYSAIQQKEEPSLYLLFAPLGDDYMYHGLNFAAYGGKVNKFDGITGNSTLENKGINNTDLMTKYGFRYVPISSIYDLLSDDELNYNMNNEGMTLKEYYSKYPTAKIAVNKNNRIVTANDLKDLERKTILVDTLSFTPENWLSLRVEKPDGTKYDQTDIDALNSHLKEYRNIELASKQNGSWLKLPDGSVWNGDPRVWIMMQSNAFTKNYRQQPWYTGLGEWPTMFNYGDGEIKTNKMIRAPYYNDLMWFSNSKKYGDTFAYIWDSKGLSWRRNKENERNIKGNNFISAIPKIGNYRKLTPPEHNSIDNWQSMPYELNGNSIDRLPRNRIMKNLVDMVADEPLFENTRVDQEDILTDDVANWSKQLGDDGLFMYLINDGPVATPYRSWEDIKYSTDFSLNNKTVNEFISLPGFTNKIKFIEGNNGNFNINDPYKYKAFGGTLNNIYL